MIIVQALQKLKKPTPPKAPPTPKPPAQPAPQPPTPAPVSNASAQANFDNGQYAPLTPDTPGHLSIVADPTNSGRNQSLQVLFEGTSDNDGVNADLNQFASWQPKSGLSHGALIKFEGEVFFPLDTARILDPGVLRKLNYWRTDPQGGSPGDGGVGQCDTVLLMWGNQVGISVTTPATEHHKYNLCTITPGEWTRLGITVQMNSAPGKDDGSIEIFKNGVSVGSMQNIRFSDPNDPVSTRFTWLSVGHQREGTSGDAHIKETRLWDNVSFTVTEPTAA